MCVLNGVVADEQNYCAYIALHSTHLRYTDPVHRHSLHRSCTIHRLGRLGVHRLGRRGYTGSGAHRLGGTQTYIVVHLCKGCVLFNFLCDSQSHIPTHFCHRSCVKLGKMPASSMRLWGRNLESRPDSIGHSASLF